MKSRSRLQDNIDTVFLQSSVVHDACSYCLLFKLIFQHSMGTQFSGLLLQLFFLGELVLWQYVDLFRRLY